jgi:acyl-[acyl carrier protein]--UDP-N-acetylglucosamine O-acyltransferase
MNKKLAAALIATPVVLVAGIKFYLTGSEAATLDRPIFNDFDKKKLKQAYKEMFREIVTGKADFDAATKSTEELDAILIERYNKL